MHCAESVQAAPSASFDVQTRLAGSQVLASSHTAGMHACPGDTTALHVPSLRQTRDAHASANVQGVAPESSRVHARVDGSQYRPRARSHRTPWLNGTSDPS